MAVFGGACSAVGEALQSRSVSTLPDVPETDLDIAQPMKTIEALRVHYISDWLFIAGAGLEIVGAFIALFSMKFLRIEEAHQAGVLGLCALAQVSRYHLREYHSKREWIGITIAILCTMLVARAFPHGLHPTKDWTADWEMELGATYILLLSVVFVYIGWYIISKVRESAGPKASAPISVLGEIPQSTLTKFVSESIILPGTTTWQDTFMGISVGALFGLAASMLKCGFIVAHSTGIDLWDIFGVSVAVILVVGAVIIRTEALRRGSTMIICTMSRMVSISTLVLVSTVFLDETIAVDTSDEAHPEEDKFPDTDDLRNYLDYVGLGRRIRMNLGFIGMFIAVLILMSTSRSSSPLRAAMAAKDG